MIIITGGAGFIGSNLVKTLNTQGYDNILVVDNLTNGTKFKNLLDCKIIDYKDKDDFMQSLLNNKFNPEKIEAIFHQGACTNTTEWDGRYMLQNNYQYSKNLLLFALQHRIPFIYASSAAVYGLNTNFAENTANESPLNVYGYSKLLFDRYVRRVTTNVQSQVVGLRYFNVYGPNEAHKKSMASTAHHFTNQIKANGVANLFEGSDGYKDGEQKRDFVYVGDVVDVNLWFWQNPTISGIYNVGTGVSQSFNVLAQNIIDHQSRGKIKYMPFPENLKGYYQSFTEADLTNLRKAGYKKQFTALKDGIKLYFS